MSSQARLPISALPLPPSSRILTHNLTPDLHTSSPSAFRKVQESCPSIQRKARLLAPQSHFSYVTPCPIAFPYKMAPEEGEQVDDQSAFIEKWLSEREPLHEKPNALGAAQTPLKKFYPKKRDQHLELVGLSETGLRDCLPHLNVGDAFELLGSPTLSQPFEDEAERSFASDEDVAARTELIEVLSGHATLMAIEEDAQTPWAPWALRYSGHQFGVFAGQLGDGRAISILATPHPSDSELICELQLKGAGRTPFARTADGLAVVRSSIREFLCAEAMHALSIPTTRVLSLISLPATPVMRERIENASVLTRLAPSFIRIGSFEALNPPANMSFFGGGQQKGNLEALRQLGEWVARRVLRLEGVKWRDEGDGIDGDAWGKKLVLEVARRNAQMVAGWQAYGFMHGVINTDNVSVLGLTIDYGPYAFMDVFDPFHICNHSDDAGRYAYNSQPSMIIYALRALLTALSPLIGAEAELGNRAVSPGWADNISDEKIAEWSKMGTKLVEEEMVTLAQETCAEEYGRLMHKRLALRRIDKDDESKLARPLLNLMSDHRLDFHSTFRRLASFKPSMAHTVTENSANSRLEEFISGLLTLTPEPELLDRDRAVKDWKAWLERYAARIKSEQQDWLDGMTNGAAAEEISNHVDARREAAAKSANPRFVLRQWVLEDVIKMVERDVDSGKRVMRKVLQMACTPFEPWGAEGIDAPEASLGAETREERRYCGLGEKRMLGFQCSCSS